MPTLRATKELRYAGQQHAVGDVFKAPDRDARLLVAIRKAEAVPDRPIGKEPEPNPAEGDDEGTRQKRAYRRRDMQAEG